MTIQELLEMLDGWGIIVTDEALVEERLGVPIESKLAVLIPDLVNALENTIALQKQELAGQLTEQERWEYEVVLRLNEAILALVVK